jgi:fibronectin-binding autotransporter adhesin
MSCRFDPHGVVLRVASPSKLFGTRKGQARKTMQTRVHTSCSVGARKVANAFTAASQRRRRNRGARAGIALAVATVSVANVYAATSTYTGGGSGTTSTPVTGSWNTSGNWSPSGVPSSNSSSTVLDFNGSGSTAYTSTNNISNFKFGTIALDSTASVTENIAESSGDDFAEAIFANEVITQNGSGAFLISNNFSLAGSTLELEGSGTGVVTLSGTIADGFQSASVTKSGTSTFVLTNAGSSYTGGTTISGGILQINADGIVNGGSVNIDSGGTFLINNTASTAALNLNSGGTLRGTGTGAAQNATITIATTTNGTFTIDTSSSATDVFTIGNAANQLAGGAASSTITVDGSGTVVLAQSNSSGYAGSWDINSGTLKISADPDLGKVPTSTVTDYLVVNGGTFATTATMTLSSFRGVNIGSSVGTFDVAGSTTLSIGGIIANVSGQAGALTKSGSGILNLSGVDTYTGATSITGGILQLGVAGALTNTSGVTVSSGAALDLNGFNPTASVTLNLNGTTGTATVGALTNSSAAAATYAGTVSLQSASSIGSSNGNITLSNSTSISVNNALTKVGSDTLILAGSNASSTTTISAGTLQIGNGSAGGALGTSTVSDSGTLAIDISGPFSIASGNAISGSGGLTQMGGGTTTVSSANTYTGVTTISAGTLSTGASGILANGGTASSIGQATNVAANLVLTGGTLQYANTGAAESTDHLFTLGSAGGTLQASGTNSITFSNTGSIAYSATGLSPTLTLGGTGAGVFDPIIGNDTSGTTALNVNTTGAWTLAGASTYTGVTTISAGTLSTGTSGILANGGTASSIGQATNVAANLVLNGGTLQYANTGAAESTDHLFTLGSAGGTLQASGTNSITFSNTGSIAYSATGLSPTLTLGGTGVGVFDPIIGNDGVGTTALNVNTSGVWTLKGANTYTGGTSIASSAVLNIQNNTALGGSTGSVTIANGGTLQLQGGITTGTNPLSIAGTGDPTTSGALDNVSSNNTYAGLLTLASSAIISSDSGTLYLTNAGTITGSTYNLTLAGTAGSGNITSIIGTGTGQVIVSSGGVWTLAGASTYTGVTTISAGTLSTGTTGILANGGVASSIGESSNAAANLVLNGGILQYANTGAAESTDHLFTLGSAGGTLQASGTNPITFSNTGSIAYSAINLSPTLTLGGTGIGVFDPIIGSDTGGTTALNVNTTGVWTLKGADTYTGATTVSAGILQLGAAGALGSASSYTSGVTVSNGAALDLNSITPTATAVPLNLNGTTSTSTVGALTNSTGTAVTYGGAVTLQTASSIGSSSGNIILSNNISGAYGLTKVGSDTLILTGTNGTTTTTISAGTLQIGAGLGTGALGSSTVSDSGTLAIDLNGAFSIAPANAISGSGALNQIGTGITTITSTNSYSGGTTISAGTIRANSSTTSLGTGAVTIASGGTLGGNGSVGNGSNLLTVQSGGAIAAGSTATTYGTLTTGSNSWQGGGNYVWKLSTAGSVGVGVNTGNSGSDGVAGTGTGTAGSSWDLVTMSALNVSQAGVTSSFIITPTASLSTANGEYSWVIAQVTGTLTLPSGMTLGENLLQNKPSGTGTVDAFVLNTAGFSVNGISNQSGATGSTFSLEFVNVGGSSDLILSYGATPEPGTTMLVAAGVMPILARRRRRPARVSDATGSL